MSNINKNRITCTLTGKVVRVAPRTFDQRAAKFGGVDLLIANYVSAEGRSLLREGLSVADIRSKYNVPESITPPAISVIERYTRWAKYSRKSQKVLEPIELTSNSISDIK